MIMPADMLISSDSVVNPLRTAPARASLRMTSAEPYTVQASAMARPIQNDACNGRLEKALIARTMSCTRRKNYSSSPFAQLALQRHADLLEADPEIHAGEEQISIAHRQERIDVAARHQPFRAICGARPSATVRLNTCQNTSPSVLRPPGPSGVPVSVHDIRARCLHAFGERVEHAGRDLEVAVDDEDLLAAGDVDPHQAAW